MPNSPIPTPNQSTAPIIDTQIPLDGAVADADGSSVATLTGFTREAIAINEPAFGPAKVALVSSASSAMTVPSDGQSQAMKRFAVELLVCPGQFAGDPVRLIESQSTPFSLSLEVGSAGKYSLVGSMHLHHSPQASATTGWSRVVAKDVAKVGDWLTVAMLWDGDAMSLFVDGKIVARRVFRDSEIVFLASIASTHFFVGTWVDGKRNRFVGKIAGLRVWNTVPSKYTAALTTAEATGLGAIASRHEDLGGDAGSLGVAKSTEQTMGSGRWQMFTNGAIAWRADTGARVIPAPMHTIYNAQRARDSLGFPIQDEGSRGNTRALYFEKGAIFHSNATGTGAVWGSAYLRHVTLTNVLGLPKSAMPTGNAQNPDMITQFERGRIYQAAHTGAFEVHGLIHEYYLTLGGPTGMLGLPVSDEEPVRNATGAEIGRVSSFEKGSIYFSGPTGAHEVHGMILDAYRKLGGPAGELGFPITDERNAANGIAYSAFQNGVLVWRSGWTSAKAIREYKVFVENAHQASGIDDGDESTGEFYAKVTIEANGQVIANQRFPKSGNSNGNVNIASTWSVPIRHDTTIYLKVDVWDWDSASADDYHGRIEQRYDINTLWGTLNADPKLDGDVGIWNNQPLTTKTADTPKLTSIQFNYRISSEAVKVDPLKFREQGWWKFDNFSTPVLSKDLFTQTFRDVDQVTNTWETILNPLDAAFYEYAFKGAASGGNCFGMSTEGFRALQGHSQFPQHISRFEKAQAEKHINIKQASQLSADMFHWTVRNVKNLDLIEPIDVFETARKEIDARGACIISMMNLANGTGHAVLAYRYEMGGPNNRYGCLFVADPNLPWPRANAAHPTYIEVFKNNSFSAATIKTANNPSGFSSAPIDLGITSLPTTMIMPVPYRIVSGVPRSMIWEVVATALTLGVYLIFAGDATTEQVNVAGNDLYGANRAIKRNHPLVPVALLDHDAPPTLLTGTSRLTGPTSFDLRGTKQGSYRHAAVLGQAGYELTNPVAAGARDKLSVESPSSAFPLLSFDVDSAAAKSAQLEYFVARDPNNRPARSFSMQLQQAKGDVARIGIDARGGALMVSPGGAPKPFDIHYSVVDAGGQVRRNVLRGVTPSSGPEALRIVADDWMNPQGNFAIERLSSLSGGVLERKTLKGT